MPKFKVYWKAKGSLGQRKQGNDIIEADNVYTVEDVIEKELTRDIPSELNLKIVSTINLFDAGCEYWEVTKIIPIDD